MTSSVNNIDEAVKAIKAINVSEEDIGKLKETLWDSFLTYFTSGNTVVKIPRINII